MIQRLSSFQRPDILKFFDQELADIGPEDFVKGKELVTNLMVSTMITESKNFIEAKFPDQSAQFIAD